MSNMDDSDGDYIDEDWNDYYNKGESDYDESQTTDDAEYFSYESLSVDKVDKLITEMVNYVSSRLRTDDAVSKILLYKNDWSVDNVLSKYDTDPIALLTKCQLKPVYALPSERKKKDNPLNCAVCVSRIEEKDILSLECGHEFCISCWMAHVETKVSQGCSVEITCMAPQCDLLMLENFVSQLPLESKTFVQYERLKFENFVKSNPQLKFCVGADCKIVFKAAEPLSKRIKCPSCGISFCFKCGDCYHAPTDCETIKNWRTKCKDDSETANYFAVHTKDCPNCKVCIEKNGGCNHMQCCNCKFDFCWMCLGSWKLHGSEYYECSRFKENQDVINESAKARAALKKYLHYYERWYNHAKSLKLEEQSLNQIKARINKKVMKSSGTWIDWQYLLDAAMLLAKCRYTLQYTYPYAYYMKNEPRKDLFEYQQAQLEAEIENLSWKIERAEATDRGDLENQMSIAEKRRKTLLKDFFPAQ